MRSFATFATACALLLAPSTLCAQWAGTYRVDINKSHLGGDTIAFTRTPDGLWHFVGDSATYDFAPDGKPYPLDSTDNTETVTIPDPHTMHVLIQHKGHTVVTLHQTLSADANTFTEASTSAATNAVTTTTYKRTGPGEGFLGKWISTQVTSTALGGMLTIGTTPDGVFTWAWGQGPSQVIITGKPDGTPLRPANTKERPDDTITFKTVSPTRMDFTNRSKDKITTTGYMQLSADGKSLDDVYWDPANPTTKNDKLYIRQ